MTLSQYVRVEQRNTLGDKMTRGRIKISTFFILSSFVLFDSVQKTIGDQLIEDRGGADGGFQE